MRHHPQRVVGSRRRALLYIVLLSIIGAIWLWSAVSSLHFSRDAHSRFATGSHGGADGADAALAAVTSPKERQRHIVTAARNSWALYRRHALGADEVRPISQVPFNWADGSVGVSFMVVDSLDTLLLMGLSTEAEEAMQYIELEFDIDARDVRMSVFESTIRVLGGLLSAYEATQRPVLLQRAVAFGDVVLHGMAQHRHNRGALLPPRRVRFTYAPSALSTVADRLQDWWNGDDTFLSEFGTLSLEFTALSHHTKNNTYANFVEGLLGTVKPHARDGLYPIRWTAQGTSVGSQLGGLGARADSFYEYLLKQWLLGGKTRPHYKEMFDGAMVSFMQHTSRTAKGVVVVNGKLTDNMMEHLACFSGGLFALSYHHSGNENHLTMARSIAETCHKMYRLLPSGLAPDRVRFHDDGSFEVVDTRFRLRPETLETFFVLWRVTGDEKYRDWAWEIFVAIETHLKVEATGGYCNAADVTKAPVVREDRMETFWMAETLKYLFLLFSEEKHFDLDHYVFNTEAHPLKVFEAGG